MINRPEDLGAAQAQDYRETNDEPTKEEFDKALVDTLKLIGGIAVVGIIMVTIIMANYLPAPEFHG